MTGKYKPTGSMIGRAKTVGYEITKTGKRKAKTEYINLMPTAQGEYELSEWVKRGLREVEELGMRELYERIIDHSSSSRRRFTVSSMSWTFAAVPVIVWT